MVEHRRFELLTSTMRKMIFTQTNYIVLICLFVLAFAQFDLIKYYINL